MLLHVSGALERPRRVPGTAYEWQCVNSLVCVSQEDRGMMGDGREDGRADGRGDGRLSHPPDPPDG